MGVGVTAVSLCAGFGVVAPWCLRRLRLATSVVPRFVICRRGHDVLVTSSPRRTSQQPAVARLRRSSHHLHDHVAR